MVEILRDAQVELKQSRRGSSSVKGLYPGQGGHGVKGMFDADGAAERIRGEFSSELGLSAGQ